MVRSPESTFRAVRNRAFHFQNTRNIYHLQIGLPAVIRILGEIHYVEVYPADTEGNRTRLTRVLPNRGYCLRLPGLAE